MGLANENKTPHTETAQKYVDGLAQQQAKNLASKLVKFESNRDPREAPSPAQGVHIRRIVPYRVIVDTRCKDHNSAVQSLGREGEFQR